MSKGTVFEGAVFKGAADLSNPSEQQGGSAASPSRLAAALGGNGGVGGIRVRASWRETGHGNAEPSVRALFSGVPS